MPVARESWNVLRIGAAVGIDNLKIRIHAAGEFGQHCLRAGLIQADARQRTDSLHRHAGALAQAHARRVDVIVETRVAVETDFRTALERMAALEPGDSVAVLIS